MSTSERGRSFGEGQEPRLRTSFELTAVRTVLRSKFDRWENSRKILGVGKEPADPLNDSLWAATPEPIGAAIHAARVLRMSSGLLYAMGEYPNEDFRELPEMIDEQILSGALDLSSAVDLSATTRPLSEISFAAEIIGRKVEGDIFIRFGDYMRDQELEGKPYIAPQEVGTLWQTETLRGTLEALDYALGADNEIANLINDDRT